MILWVNIVFCISMIHEPTVNMALINNDIAQGKEIINGQRPTYCKVKFIFTFRMGERANTCVLLLVRENIYWHLRELICPQGLGNVRGTLFCISSPWLARCINTTSEVNATVTVLTQPILVVARGTNS